MNKQIIILGNGGHAEVLTEILLEQNRKVIGFTSPEKQDNRFGLTYLGTDQIIETFDCREVDLVLGLGSIIVASTRKKIFDYFTSKQFTFANVIHHKAIISPYVELGEGIQVMAGAIIQPFTRIADNTIINTSASVDHDCIIERHSHIAPGVVMSGNVTVGEGSHIGVGAKIIQNICIGSNVLIGAGSVVVNDILNNRKAYGVPAKEV